MRAVALFALALGFIGCTTNEFVTNVIGGADGGTTAEGAFGESPDAPWPADAISSSVDTGFADQTVAEGSAEAASQVDGRSASEGGGSADAGLDVQQDVRDATTVETGDASPDGSVGPGQYGDGCAASGSCTDFPSAPVLDDAGGPVANGPSLFSTPADPSAGNAPCLIEPADGCLYPYNWLRPRVYWGGVVGQAFFEVRFHSDAELNDYVVYTTNDYWELDKSTWQQIAGTLTAGPGNLAGTSITVSVRGSTGSGAPSAPATATFAIAPAIAPGSLVFWSTASYDNSATSTNLEGFTVGDEGTTLALSSLNVSQPVVGNPYNRATGTVDTSQTVTNAQVWCIGCHTATPDGVALGFTAEWPWSNAVATVNTLSGTGGLTPTWMSETAEWNLAPDKNTNTPPQAYYAPPAVDQVTMGISTFSRAHYEMGDHVMVASIGAAWNAYTFNTGTTTDLGFATGVASQLIWLDLEAEGELPVTGLPLAPQTTAVAIPDNPAGGGTQGPITGATSGIGWGTITRTGDTNSAGAPSWSNDGTNIAYASTDFGTKDGRMDCEHMSMAGNTATSCTSDIRVVPYNANAGAPGGAGGTSVALPGASDPAQNEYYPAWSPDDQIIAFNRVPVNHSMYNTTEAEVYVVPYNGGAGGTAIRLVANDPVACSGYVSPGVQNTWPKWAPNPVSSTRLADGGVAATGEPAPQTIDGLTYYWVTFSSNRSPTTSSEQQQLYVAGVTMDLNGNIQTYAPIYLWNQSDLVNNLVPSWGTFALPPPNVTPVLPQHPHFK
jgi:hypothetical protein